LRGVKRLAAHAIVVGRVLFLMSLAAVANVLTLGSTRYGRSCSAILVELLRYYRGRATGGSWISPRSVNGPR